MSGQKRPNILFLFSDQQRSDTLGCYGQKLPVTPNLDRLAGEGVRFENTFTCQPVCGPARAALQTGKWAARTGCFTNGIALPEHERTMAHYFSDAGYETGYVGKWHLASTIGKQDYMAKAVPARFRGGYRGFWVAADVLEFTSHGYGGRLFDKDNKPREFPETRYRADAVTDFALEFLDGRKKDRPFFLFVSYIEPHHQNDRKRYEAPKGYRERFTDYEVPGDLEGMEGDWKEHFPDYLGCCCSLDENAERIISRLKSDGLYDNTVIIYTSDHGNHFRTRNSEYKRSCHDACLRIPLIIRGPGFTGNVTVRELVSLLDLTPTVLDAAGLSKPAVMDGRSLAPLVKGEARDWPGNVFAQISEDHVGRAIRTAKWKYEVWVPSDRERSGWDSPGSQVYTERFLYDLELDPYEKRNLITDPCLAGLRRDLADILVRRMEAAGEPRPEIRPAG